MKSRGHASRGLIADRTIAESGELCCGCFEPIAQGEELARYANGELAHLRCLDILGGPQSFRVR